MGKRTYSEEEKEVIRQRMAKARAARKVNLEKKIQEELAPAPEQSEPTPLEAAVEEAEAAAPTPTAPADSLGELSVNQLAAMVLELQQRMLTTQAAPVSQPGAMVQNGRVMGISEKFTTNRDVYQDPRERLRSEPRLKRIAFDENYELDFEITDVTYETKAGIQERQPKFTIALNQIVLDDQGEKTNQRIGKTKMVFFEDPDTAIKIASDYGLPIDDQNRSDFLNDMRYIRVRDWLFECFWPNKPTSKETNVREIVVNGQAVRTWEVASESSQKIDYSALHGSKLKV